MNTKCLIAACVLSVMLGQATLVRANDAPEAPATPHQFGKLSAQLPLSRAKVRIRVQSKLAVLAIREELMAEFHANSSRQLSSVTYRVHHFAAAGGGDSESVNLKKAEALFKSVKFEWPEFMPRGLQ